MKFFGKLTVSILLICLCTLVVGMKRPVFKSAGVNHLLNQVNAPSDLYDPIIEDACFLWEKGRVVTYPLIPKYHDIYEVGLRCDGDLIPCNYVFDGKLLVEFLEGGRVIKSEIVNSILTRSFAGNDMNFDNRLELLRFNLPLDGKYWENVSLKVTVLQPAEILKKYEHGLKFYVAVSSTP